MRVNGRTLAFAAVATAVAAFAASLAGQLAGGGTLDVEWAPTLGLRLDLAFDGLGAMYALIATGIGALVFAYGAAYLPRHLEHAKRPGGDARRFWPWMVLFMGSMVGLACARDLVLMFVFFDLTAVASYFLIGFDHDRREARGAALMALLVTGVTAVALLIGAVLLYAEYGTFSLPELFERAEPGTTTAIAAALIAFAAVTKSAQVPLHFWLPRAMEAPTPVSAYLHSAAMVAAGVLVLGRVHPLLALDDTVLDALVVVGLCSIVIGGALALAQDNLKQILAHSTISQYGYVVVLYGIGGEKGAAAAALYVIAHAIAKSALFMTAGAVTEATGERRLSHLGDAGRAAADDRVLQGRAVLRGRGRARRVHAGHGRGRRGAHVRLHRPLLARRVHRPAPHGGARDPGAAGGADRAAGRARGRGRDRGGAVRAPGHRRRHGHRRGGGRGPSGLPPGHPRGEPDGARRVGAGRAAARVAARLGGRRGRDRPRGRRRRPAAPVRAVAARAVPALGSPARRRGGRPAQQPCSCPPAR
jgi:NADH:ubiquinone oxidoreductase subunit 2 (subunit N)